MQNLRETLEHESRLTAAFNSIIVLLILSVLFYLIQQCEPEPTQARNDDIAKKELILRLSQCVIGECGHCKINGPERDRERNAIGWCLKKQAKLLKRTLLKQTINYCAFYKQKTERATFIFWSREELPLYGKKQLWIDTRKWAVSFIDHPPTDPEPRANQWGGDMDIHRAIRWGWEYVAGPPEYANTFWRSRALAKLER